MYTPDVIVFVREKEKRPPKKGEWFLAELPELQGDILTADYDFILPRFCFTRHDLNIPEGATSLTIQARGDCQTPPAVHIPLPRKKVARWYWTIPSASPKGAPFTTLEPFTEEEVKTMYPQKEWYHEIDETIREE